MSICPAGAPCRQWLGCDGDRRRAVPTISRGCRRWDRLVLSAWLRDTTQSHCLWLHNLVFVCFPVFFVFVQLEMTNLFQRTPVKNNIFMSLPQLARVCAGNAGDLSAAACKHRRWTSCTAHERVLLSPGKQLFPYFISSSFPLFPICEGFQIPLKVRSCFCKITYSSDT